MRFSCKFDYYPAPCEPNLFINPVTIDVLCNDTSYGEQVVARMSIDHLDLMRAEACGEDVLIVCDADSAGWEAVYSALFEPGNDFVELRRDFNFGEPVFDILFMHRSLFHSAVDEWRMFILDHAACLFGESTAFVMWKNETGLTNSELSQLGVRKIAGHDLHFRPNMLKTDFDRSGFASRILDFEVPKGTGAEFEAAWQGKYELENT